VCVREGAQRSQRQPLERHARLWRAGLGHGSVAALRRGVEPGRGGPGVAHARPAPDEGVARVRVLLLCYGVGGGSCVVGAAVALKGVRPRGVWGGPPAQWTNLGRSLPVLSKPGPEG
jgi:hypothetical protein